VAAYGAGWWCLALGLGSKSSGMVWSLAGKKALRSGEQRQRRKNSMAAVI